MSASANIGVPMIGSYVNVMLYTLELVEAYIYYFASPRSSKDPKFLKCCVGASLVSDTVGTIGVCALTFITNRVFTDTVTADKIYWAFQMYIISNVLSSFVFQSYMGHRYWVLSRNYIVSAFIIILILASLATNIGLAANNRAIVNSEVFTAASVHLRQTWIIVILVTAMLTDVSITIALLWQLNITGLYSPLNLQTKRLVARISSQAIKTGVVTCLFALITLVTYLSYKNQSIATCVAYMLGRVYTATMLFSLIYRDKLLSGDELRNATLPSLNGSDSASGMIRIRPNPVFSSQETPKGRPQHDNLFTDHKSYELTSSHLTSPDPHKLELTTPE